MRHSWARVRVRWTRVVPHNRVTAREFAVRLHCRQCGAVTYSVLRGEYYRISTAARFYRPWGGVDREIYSMPSCDGKPPADYQIPVGM